MALVIRDEIRNEPGPWENGELTEVREIFCAQRVLEDETHARTGCATIALETHIDVCACGARHDCHGPHIVGMKDGLPKWETPAAGSEYQLRECRKCSDPFKGF